jgi:hypothetical protein
MSIGQSKRAARNRIVALFPHSLGYGSLEEWHDRPENGTVEDSRLHFFLSRASPAYCPQVWERFKVRGNRPRREEEG